MNLDFCLGPRNLHFSPLRLDSIRFENDLCAGLGLGIEVRGIWVPDLPTDRKQVANFSELVFFFFSRRLKIVLTSDNICEVVRTDT